MKATERQEFAVKCECMILRNNLQINQKKKSKFTLIGLNVEKELLTAMPFGSQKEEEMLTFPLAKLKAIHKKYIEEGKVTLEFMERTERLQLKGTSVTNPDELVEVNSQILISSASKENLQLLIKKIVAIKNKPDKKPTPVATVKKQAVKKRPSDIAEVQQKRPPLLSRKELINNAVNPPKIVHQNTPKFTKIAFFELPAILIDQIFCFCKMSLEMRVISRRFSEHILNNISRIKLNDEIDERSFNKLAKWAVEVDCRMKNVRNLELSDRFEQQELVQGRAKTLKFGGWKEITAKNIMQLKGLRIYCLEMPYFIKFDLSQLFGLRLVQLRLKSAQLTANRCQFVKTEDLVYLLKTIKDLRVLELPYSNSDLLAAIDQPKKMTEIKIYFLNDNSKEEAWKDLSRFENLKMFSLWNVEKLGVRKEDHEITLKLPENLAKLEVGHFISREGLEKLPISLQYLKLIGQNFFNTHAEAMYLPQLKLLDISTSRNVRHDILEFMQNMEIITFWGRHTVEYVNAYAVSKGIRLSTLNPDFN